MPRPLSTLLDSLASTLTALAEVLRSTPPAAAPTTRRTGRRTATPTVRRTATPPSPRLALQGKYMAALRGLSVAQKVKVKKVLATQGVEAAISFAQSKKA